MTGSFFARACIVTQTHLSVIERGAARSRGRALPCWHKYFASATLSFSPRLARERKVPRIAAAAAQFFQQFRLATMPRCRHRARAHSSSRGREEGGKKRESSRGRGDKTAVAARCRNLHTKAQEEKRKSRARARASRLPPVPSFAPAIRGAEYRTRAHLCALDN